MVAGPDVRGPRLEPLKPVDEASRPGQGSVWERMPEAQLQGMARQGVEGAKAELQRRSAAAAPTADPGPEAAPAPPEAPKPAAPDVVERAVQRILENVAPNKAMQGLSAEVKEQVKARVKEERAKLGTGESKAWSGEQPKEQAKVGSPEQVRAAIEKVLKEKPIGTAAAAEPDGIYVSDLRKELPGLTREQQDEAILNATWRDPDFQKKYVPTQTARGDDGGIFDGRISLGVIKVAPEAKAAVRVTGHHKVDAVIDGTKPATWDGTNWDNASLQQYPIWPFLQKAKDAVGKDKNIGVIEPGQFSGDFLPGQLGYAGERIIYNKKAVEKIIRSDPEFYKQFGKSTDEIVRGAIKANKAGEFLGYGTARTAAEGDIAINMMGSDGMQVNGMVAKRSELADLIRRYSKFDVAKVEIFDGNNFSTKQVFDGPPQDALRFVERMAPAKAAVDTPAKVEPLQQEATDVNRELARQGITRLTPEEVTGAGERGGAKGVRRADEAASRDRQAVLAALTEQFNDALGTAGRDKRRLAQVREEFGPLFESLGVEMPKGKADAPRQTEKGMILKPGGEKTPDVVEGETAQRFKGLLDELDLTPDERRVADAIMHGDATIRALKKQGVKSPAYVGERVVEKIKAHLAEKYPEYADRVGGAKTLEQLKKGLMDVGAVAETRDVAFAGFPLKLTFLDNLFKQGFSPTAAIKKWFSSAGSLPREVFDEHNEATRKVAAYVEDVRNAEKDMRKAVSYDTLTEAQVKDMNAALGGDRAAMARQTPEVQAVLGKMRREVDVLSAALIKEGAIDGPLAATVQGNVGAYLNRSYRAFTDPNWAANVPEPVKNKFMSWMDAELRAKGHTPAPGEVEGVMMKLLHNGTAADNPIAFLSKSKLGSKDLSILTQRKDVPPELRALWGEHEDPLVNYAHSVGKMSNMLQNHIFLSNVKKMGLGKYLFDKPTPEAYMPIADEGTKSMAPLAGLHTTPEIKAAFDEIYSPKESNWAVKAWMSYLGLAKVSKTVWSPVATIRNNVGNIGFSMMNGHWRVHETPMAIKSILDDSPAGRDYWRRATELGLTTDGLDSGDFAAMAKHVLGRREDAPFTSRGMLTDRSLARAAAGGLKGVEKLYQVQDTIYKLAAFENEKARYQKANPTWTPEQVERHAAKIVLDTFPTYSMVPKAVKLASRFPVVGSFVNFPSEVVRTTYNSMKLTAQELANPATRAIGAQRLAGTVMALTASAGLAAGTRAIFGVTQDEENDMRRFMPEWSKDSPIIHIGTNDKGERRYVDIGGIDPHAYLTKPVMALLRGEDPKQALMDAVSGLADPFTSEEIGVSPVLDIARNKKKSGGEVFNPQAPKLDIAKDMAAHAWKAIEPGAITTGRRLYKAATGEPDKKTGRKYDLADEAVLVARPTNLDVKGSLPFKARDFQKAEQDAVKLLMSVVRQKGMVSDQEIVAAHGKMEQARRRLFEEMREDALAAQRLGMTSGEVRAALKSAQVSDEDINSVMSGKYTPHQTKKLPGLETNEANRRLNVIRSVK